MLPNFQFVEGSDRIMNQSLSVAVNKLHLNCMINRNILLFGLKSQSHINNSIEMGMFRWMNRTVSRTTAWRGTYTTSMKMDGFLGCREFT